MEDNLCAAALMDSTTSKIEQLQKAFAELESHRAVNLNLKWKQLEEHFHGLQKSLKRRFNELEEQEKDFETKTAESKRILEERKAAVVAKEQTSLQKLQEQRDAAVSTIWTTNKKIEKPISLDFSVTSCEDQVEARVDDHTMPVVTKNRISAIKKPHEHINVQVKFYPELIKLCQEMNSDGLHKFISDNRKDLVTLRNEIPIALKAAPDPASLVLDSLNGFYALALDVKKGSNLLGLRRTCIMLMECLFSFYQNAGAHSIYDVISENARERAKSIAEEWKPKLDYLDMDASNGNSLEAHAFLQLLASFGISTDFDQELLFKLIPMVARRRQTAELCRHLGLSDKMPGVIHVLVRNGRQIDAVNLVFACELTHQFSPISLLKSYLFEAKKVHSVSKSGNTSPAASSQNEKELLLVLKSAIKCIEDHKLESQFPVGPLHKQVLEIEKAKAAKKQETEGAKPQSKRSRANTIARIANAPNDKNHHYPTTERYPHYVYYAAAPEHHCLPSYIHARPHPHPHPHTHTPAVYNFSLSPANFFGYQAIYMH
ncbi:FRIGIDA-like protein 3 [Andrographis paniculata]|uniref:FRIGIDA-like protein 3 n=1 Tax=Andrographis paniculata TaxID=175694 RepID=UPI0021E7624D|nr:FRIGIDA-like protein 3 [Andrographis paniculata]